MRIPALVFFAALSFALPSCTVGKYLQNRGCDLLDCFDFKAGYGGLGLGAKVQASEYVKTGIGYGEGYQTAEFYGRYKDRFDMQFLHGVLFGVDGTRIPIEFGNLEGCDTDLFLVGKPQYSTIPKIDRFRFGGEVLIPGVNFGIYFNLGEFADFLAGFAGLDLAQDDSLPIGTPLDSPRKIPIQPPEKKEPPSIPPHPLNLEQLR